MNCEKIAELMSDYVDGCLPECDCSKLEEHLRSCPQCRQQLESMRFLVDSLGCLSGCKAPVNCWPEVRQRILSRQQAKAAWYTLFFRPVVAVPAAVGAAALALILAWPSVVDEPVPTQVVTPPEYVHYIGAHSAVQSRQMLTDPDVTFIAAELEKATLVSHENR